MSEPPPSKRSRLSLVTETDASESDDSSSDTTVCAASFFQNRKRHVLEEVKRKPERKLLDLDNSSLLDIITKMDLNTLINVAETCTRLQLLAKYVFRMKYEHFDFSDLAKVFPARVVHVEKAEKLFRIFGENIKSLSIMDIWLEENTSSQITSLVQQYCTSLKTLKLDGFNIRFNSLPHIQLLFGSIENLSLYNCSLKNCSPGNMKNLKMLELNCVDCDLWADFLWKNFEKLEDVKFIELYCFSNEALVQFINLNISLKRLSLLMCSTTPAVFRAIGKLSKLEKFECEFENLMHEDFVDNLQPDVDHLSSLKALKQLKLGGIDCSLEGLLKQMIANEVPIEHFELSDRGYSRNTHEQLIKMKTIKVLKLVDIDNITRDDVLDITKNLTQLEQLRIKAKMCLNEMVLREMVRSGKSLKRLEIGTPNFILGFNKYQEILNIVKRREQNNKVEMEFFGSGHKVLVPTKIAKGPNEKWLSIKWQNRQLCCHCQQRHSGDDDSDPDDWSFEIDDELMDVAESDDSGEEHRAYLEMFND